MNLSLKLSLPDVDACDVMLRAVKEIARAHRGEVISHSSGPAPEVIDVMLTADDTPAQILAELKGLRADLAQIALDTSNVNCVE